MGEEEDGGRLGKYITLWRVRGEIEARVLVYEELVLYGITGKRVRDDGTYRGGQGNLFLRHRSNSAYDGVNGSAGNVSGKILYEDADGRDVEDDMGVKSSLHCSSISGTKGF